MFLLPRPWQQVDTLVLYELRFAHSDRKFLAVTPHEYPQQAQRVQDTIFVSIIEVRKPFQ